MQPDDIGSMIFIGGLLEIPWQAFVFPRLTKRYGFLAVTRGAMIAWASLTTLTQFVVPIFLSAKSDVQQDHDLLGWVVLVGMYSVTMIAACTTYHGIFPLITNIVWPEDSGSANGAAQTLCAVSRVIAPLVGSNVYAWSTTVAPGGMHWIVFIIASIWSLFVFAASFNIPRSADQKKAQEWTRL
jgi:hypothetical protein